MAWLRSHKKGNGGGSTEPKIVFAGCDPTGEHTGNISHTFTEGGTYQYYAYRNSRYAVTSSDVVVKINGTAVTPNFYDGSPDTFAFFYGEVNVSAGDIINVTTTTISTSNGLQLFVMKNCDVSAFSLIGKASNNTNTFNINLNGNPYLQAFQCSFNASPVQFKYGIMDYVGESVSIPNISKFYYGFTYVITLVASNNRGLAKSVEEQEEKGSEGKEMEEKKIEEPDEKVEEVKEEEVKEEER